MARFTSIGIKKRTYIPSEGPPSSPPAQAQARLPPPPPLPAPTPIPVASTSKVVATPVSTAAAVVSESTDPSVPKARKARRGTRGKKDKRVKAAKPTPTPAVATSTTTEEAGEASSSSAAEAGAAAAESSTGAKVGRQDGERGEGGRLTMAGLKGPKPGETEEEHKRRMEKKKEQKERRTKDADARVLASEQRRLARMSERERETTCFACRQKGHSARDCPNALEGDLLTEGVRTMTGKDTVNICYRCGSTSHSLKQCRAPVDKANPMPFASCFVCLGKGHLAGKCPKNAAKGVYPEGGECKICRGKDHLARDCSLRRDEQIAVTLLPSTGESGELAGPIGADEDDFHALKRKRHEVELEEQAEEDALKKRKAPRPASEIKKPAVVKKKVVAF